MNQDAETPRGLGGAFQEFSATGARPTVALVARPVTVATAGRLEFAARCPQCRNWHRHVSLGRKAAPCGARYLLEFKSRRGRRDGQ
ncbi:hypothetical protein GCM10011583_57730 [Streptomyces camponoticapitis]|uniref:Uncharacterized protein n=1 Tax=Streptomyces camponoticapitis TaxID=1616125 RepID=A0ABQ2EN63_9ACTN|nr:hypothetical protein GCM10011583_57730 [Streptomyces camponoticapitis]